MSTLILRQIGFSISLATIALAILMAIGIVERADGIAVFLVLFILVCSARAARLASPNEKNWKFSRRSRANSDV